ncbi:MAG: hypothetical protein M3Y36_03295 [Actinomycetota bacterium]|nr:hypothetical protein [Actinomycetota bacterium]
MTIARFRAGKFRLELHVGSGDPPVGHATIPAGNGDVVSSTERPGLLAAFNGGFRTSTATGGFEVAGQVLRPLTAGLASVATDANGTPSVGIWDQGLPTAGSAVVDVRQNLPPLISGGAPSPSVNAVSSWGATIGGRARVARSALGEDSAGDLLFAGSNSALPVDLADGLITAGTSTAMELDINPAWVQLDLAATPGGPLAAAVPGQSRPADQYLSGWTRDFFTVVARP